MSRLARVVIALLLFSLSLPVSAQAFRRPASSRIQDPLSFRANMKPALSIPRIDRPIVVDGDLDDPAWNGAAIATSFSETYPGDQTVPPIGIEVWVAYDDDNLYLAYVIEDDPSSVRANLSDRDAIW